MPWVKGQSGNPTGKTAKAPTLVGELRTVLRIKDPISGKGNKRAIALKLVELAIAGNVLAIKEVFDRIDGKPLQSVELGSDPNKPLMVRTIGELWGADDDTDEIPG